MEELKDETYVPKSIAEAYLFLDAYLVDQDVFKNCPEEDVMGIAHMGLGRWMRNTWHLWWSEELYERVKEKSPEYPSVKPELVEMFQDKGILHADDMSSIIIRGYHKKLNNKPFDIDGEIEDIITYYKERDNKEE